MTEAALAILLLEDVPAHAEAILRALEAASGKTLVHVVRTLRAYREAVAVRPPDIALLDLVLPDGQAVEALTYPPEAGLFPILIMTSYGNEQMAVAAMKAGALDYIVKSPEAFSQMPHTLDRTLREWNALMERKQVEDELRESEERFRTLYENSTLGLYRTTPEGQILLANPALVKMLDFSSAEELTSRNLEKSGFAPSYPRRMFLETIEKDGMIKGLESSWTKRNGTTVFVRESARAMRDSQGKTLFYDGTVEDITERKRAEKDRETLLLRQEGINQLQQSLLAPTPLDQKLKRITDNVVQLFDADFCRIWLIRPGDLCEKNCIHAAVPEGPHVCSYRERCLHLLASSGRYTHIDGKGHHRVPFGSYKIGRVASGEDHKFITNDVQNDPRVHDHEWARALGLVSFAGYQLRVPGGQTIGVLALFAKHRIVPAEDTMLDGLSSTIAQIVQQAQGEVALHRAEENFRRSLDDSPLGVRIVTLDGDTLYANKSMLDLYGYDSLEELRKTSIKKRYTPESYAEFQKRKKHRQQGGVSTEYEISIVGKGGDTRRLQVFRKEVLWNGEKQSLALYIDVTERKQAEENLKETLRRLRQAFTSTIQVLDMTVEARDPYTAGHQHRTTLLAEAIAGEIGLSPEKIEGLRMAGQIHDIGKISVPSEILSKPTGLTPVEYELVKMHAQKGYEILKDVEFSWPLAEIVYQHHERLDGSGYPRGLKGDEILIEARILAVSDTVEAMASHRPYRPARGIKIALEEIEKNKGVIYDSDVAEACLKLFREKKFSFGG